MSQVSAMLAEDEAPQRRQLREFLVELWPELEVVAECEDGLAALEAVTSLKPKVVFLDIRMPGLSGLEVARAACAHSHVVFTTAYDEYALSAFDQGALDYLLKPIKKDRLALSVERVKARLSAAPPNLTGLIDALQSQIAARPRPGGIQWITGTVGNVTRMFSIDEVLYFQAQDKCTRVVTATDEVLIRMSLRELLGTLDAEAFWQVHRSVIVRASAVQSIEHDLGRLQLRVKGREERLPVSSSFHYRFKPM